MSQVKCLNTNVTNASATVTVVGEDIRATVNAGHIFMVKGQTSPYWVAAEPTYSSITGNSTVQLTAPYAGATASGIETLFVIDFTTPDSIPLINPGDLNTAQIASQAFLRIQQLLNGLSFRSGAADPTIADVPTNTSVVWKNTSNGEIRTWVNDNGTMKKSATLT